MSGGKHQYRQHQMCFSSCILFLFINIIYNLILEFYGLYLFLYTGLLTKLSRCGWYFLLVVNSKDNSKFLTYLRYPKLFLFCKNINDGVDTVNEFMINW